MKKIKSLILLFILIILSIILTYLTIKKRIYLYLIPIIINLILINNYYLNREGSIKLCFFLNRISNYTYENIDYEINKPYLNQYELNNQIYYLECKTYLFIKISDLKDLSSF